MINLKNRGTRLKLSRWTKLFIHTSLSCAQIRKLSVHNHKTHVVQIDILTGHEKMCNLHFYSEDYFSL